jgi:hypothetical protein
MMKITTWARRALPWCFVLSSLGCPSFSNSAGARPEGHRLVEGTLTLAEDFVFSRQVSAVQLAAVVVGDDGDTATLKVHGSDPLTPDAGRAVPFVLSLPNTAAFHVVLQAPRSAANAPGEWLGLLEFDDGAGQFTSLVPASADDIDLGELVAVENVPTVVADNQLQGPPNANPLGQVDADGDGTSDLSDSDDDDDGVADAADSDVAGDGIDDALQALDRLPDDNADGIPDDFQ